MFIILLVLWIAFAGTVDSHTLIVGVIISAGLTFFCRKYMNARVRGLNRTWAYTKYILYLLGQIFLSCVSVLGFVYSGKEPQPKLVKFKADLDEGDSVLLANSITLTPGTITAELNDGEYVVHALDGKYAEGINECGFVKRLKRLEGKDCESVS